LANHIASQVTPDDLRFKVGHKEIDLAVIRATLAVSCPSVELTTAISRKRDWEKDKAINRLKIKQLQPGSFFGV
jgi:hypothetical protein